MAAEPLIDIPALLAPIPGDNPAGQPLPYGTRLKLEELRKEINPADYDADDPRRPTEFRKPDWAAIVQLATDTLTTTSKDLLAAARLTEALTIERGFAGLRDSLNFLSQVADQCWDRVYPPIEDGESAEVREGPFKWLNQAKYGAMFPHTILTVPLLTIDGKRYSCEDWLNKDRRPAFEAAIGTVKPEICQALVNDLKAAKEKLQVLNDTLAAKMGEFAPDFTSSEGTEHVGAALNDCLKVAQQILQRKTGAGGPTGSDSAAATGGSVSHSLASRADAYRMLNDAADLLKQLEPHSPIPYLVKRAVKLGHLQFPDLIKALIRESAVIDELNRLMGIEPPPAPPSQ